MRDSTPACPGHLSRTETSASVMRSQPHTHRRTPNLSTSVRETCEPPWIGLWRGCDTALNDIPLSLLPLAELGNKPSSRSRMNYSFESSEEPKSYSKGDSSASSLDPSVIANSHTWGCSRQERLPNLSLYPKSEPVPSTFLTQKRRWTLPGEWKSHPEARRETQSEFRQ